MNDSSLSSIVLSSLGQACKTLLNLAVGVFNNSRCRDGAVPTDKSYSSTISASEKYLGRYGLRSDLGKMLLVQS